jgi:hypothetical protein
VAAFDRDNRLDESTLQVYTSETLRESTIRRGMETLRGPCPLIVSTTSSDHDTVGDDSRSLPTWRSAPRRSRDWRELSSALFGAVLHMARVTPRQMASEAKRIGPAGREPVDLLPPLLSDLFRPRRSLLSAYLPATRERPGRTETFALLNPAKRVGRCPLPEATSTRLQDSRRIYSYQLILYSTDPYASQPHAQSEGTTYEADCVTEVELLYAMDASIVAFAFATIALTSNEPLPPIEPE